jgi:membrane glycosyltransferase
MDSFFALDKNEWLPLEVTAHLLVCKKCRTQVRLCTLAERASALSLMGHDEVPVAALLQRLRPAIGIEREGHFISMRRWIVLGIAMILAMILVGFVTLEPGPSALQYATYIVFAAMITAYCAFFVGSNMDFFVKQAENAHIRGAWGSSIP